MKISIQKRLRFLPFVLGVLISFSALSQTYLSQNFNSNTIPSGWNVTDLGTGDCRWMLHPPTSYNGNSLAMLGSSFLYVNSDSAGTGTDANETITSPAIATPANTQILLQFFHHFRATGSTARKDTAIVEVFNGTSWIVARKYGTSQGSGSAPVKVSLDLSTYSNPAMQIRFRYIGNFGYYWCIDNVNVFSPSPTDAGISRILAPAGSCGLIFPFQVKVVLRNYGSQAISNFPVRYKANQEPPISETFSGTILPGDSNVFTFSTAYQGSGNSAISFKAWTNLPGDTINGNDTITGPPFLRSPATMLPINFSSFTGNNLSNAYPGWQEQSGYNPTGTTSNWRASNGAQTTGQGPTTRINLFTNTRKEWIISPSFNPAIGSSLSFKISLSGLGDLQPDSMGSDDSLKIKVSTDCGQTWSTIRSYSKTNSLSNQLTSQIISLADFDGKNIRVAFYATDGTIDNSNDYDLHITDVEIRVFSPNDVAITQIILPSSECGAPASLPIKVRIANNGTQTQTSIPVRFRVNNGTPVQDTFNGTLDAGLDTVFTFSSPAILGGLGTQLLSAWTQLVGDANSQNDSIKNISVVRAPSTFPLVTFTGFSGTNLSTLLTDWKEASGQNPTGTTSSWDSPDISQSSLFGTTTARVNLYNATQREWLISKAINVEPGYYLRFKLAVTNWNGAEIDSMGSDDSLVVKVSTNCGVTWNRVKWFTKADALTNSFSIQSISLAPFAGQNIRIGFFATSGTTDNTNDYDLHLDDIEVLIPSATDVNLSSLIVPSSPCGIPASFPLKVNVINNGIQPLTSIPLTYQLNTQNPVSETFTANLAPGANQTFTFSTNVSTTSSGSYLISAWSTLAADLNKSNDSIRNVSIIRQPEVFPKNTFTGFTGANLGNVFPGWYEGAGVNGGATTSTWINSSNAQTTGLGSLSARINLFGNTKRDWIISPAFNPPAGNILKFKVAITNNGTITADSMGSDDSVHVMVTTNCGTSWTKAKSFTKNSLITNQFSTQSVSLVPFAGQTLRIGFQASDGNVNDPNDYDFHIDDVEITTPSNKDIGITEVVLPEISCGTPSPFNLKVKVTNFGAQAQSGFGVSYRVNSLLPVNETFSGTLLPGQTSEFTFAALMDLSSPGNYLINTWTTLDQDSETSNDSLKISTINNPVPTTLPTVTFTGYTGSNLAVNFPGWSEKTGQIPTGNTSSWLNSATAQTFALNSVTARVWLSGATVKDWLVSPGVSASSNTVLKFKLALTGHSVSGAGSMGSDDSLNVLVSTNCGVSWTKIRTFVSASNLTNSLVTYSQSLGGFVGQNILVGFMATEGAVDDPESYDLHLDEINISQVTGLDETLAETEIQLFPNPASSSFYIHLSDDSDIEEVRLVALDGRISNLDLTKTESSTYRADTKNLVSGIYTVIFNLKGKSVAKRIVIRP